VVVASELPETEALGLRPCPLGLRVDLDAKPSCATKPRSRLRPEPRPTYLQFCDRSALSALLHMHFRKFHLPHCDRSSNVWPPCRFVRIGSQTAGSSRFAGDYQFHFPLPGTMKPPAGPPEPASCGDVKVVLAGRVSTLTSPCLLVLGFQYERNDRAALGPPPLMRVPPERRKNLQVGNTNRSG
jgi:hypothetical protein